MKSKPIHEEHQSQGLVKAVMMTTKHEGSYKQGVKPRIQSITIPYMKQDLQCFEDYEDYEDVV